MIRFLNLPNRCTCNGFFKISKHPFRGKIFDSYLIFIDSVFHKEISNINMLIITSTWVYSIFIHFIEHWLSWYMLPSLILYSYSSKNTINHMLYGKFSLNHTSYSFVKLVLFSFCFDQLICTSPIPNYISPPVYIAIFVCTTYAT